MNNNLVSVLMPVFNAEPFLKESISSILNQSFDNFIFIIINDGSTDKSKDIIFSFNDSRIVYLENESNKGLIFTLNRALELVSTKYFVRMDADDISHLKRIEFLVKAMEEDHQISVCGTEIGDIDSESLKPSLVDNLKLKTIQLLNCSITHASAIYRTEILKLNFLKYNEKYLHAEDDDLITNLCLVSKVSKLDVPLYWVRKHEGQVSKLFRNVQKSNSVKIRAEFFYNLTGYDFNELELIQLKAICFKENDLNINDFNMISKFIKILLSKLKNQESYAFDYLIFEKLIYYRLRIVYMSNYNIGFRLYYNYLCNFLFDSRLKIGVKLFSKIFLSKLNVV